MELLGAKWSEYKHHNTVKYFVCVATNLDTIFDSKAFTGRISDKKLKLKSGILDMLPEHCSIMPDKGFNLFDECDARSFYFIVPPGRRGTAQMAPDDISKTSNIAKVRIPVEEVIMCMKIFQILPNELPISMLSSIDSVCSFA